MNKQLVERTISHLLEQAKKLSFGTASAVLKVHEGKITHVCFETVECIKERKEVQNEA